MPTLIEDYESGDPRRVLHAVWQTIGCRDPELLKPLVTTLPRLRSRTEGVELGGMIYLNSTHLDHAFRVIENYRDGLCWCMAYPDSLTYDPRKEQDRGHAEIRSTSTPGWEMTYECACTVCGQVFDVEQGDHHVTWWRWVPRGLKRRRSAAADVGGAA
ncbi:hypothetical protein [Microbacterium sp. GCS4]|uniref:hypothetical protein n=1 Tax=Microbacterium sp. GCS4 TaxID=1692239 RepID=UPI0006803975|nr:hypothetical protein [Microbacterium sp. GCS4]KNY06968.1 hypothetical protein AKH00_01180 [Microbacterium sp. GCS4]